MTEQQAILKVETLAATLRPPTLTLDEIRLLLAGASREDSNGYAPSDLLWTPTYDLNRAVADAWELKAAKAADQFAFSEDGQSYSREQLIDHCLRMADRYKRKIVTTILTGAGVGTTAAGEEA